MNVEMLRLEMHGSSGRAQPKLWRPLHRQSGAWITPWHCGEAHAMGPGFLNPPRHHPTCRHRTLVLSHLRRLE